MSETFETRALREGVTAIEDLDAALAAGTISATEYSESINKLSENATAAIQGVKTFSTVISAWNTIFNATADLVSGNIDELVALYNAQINVIQKQNLYTQAIALQSTAVNIYGKNSEQATRATTAASYVGALYTQSKKDETVAMNKYMTATAQNLATIATSFTEVITSLNTFDIALGAVAMASADSAARMAIAAIPLIGGIISLGLGAYQLATTPHVTPPGMQTGGYVPKTSLYMLHQGETVIPKGGPTGTGGGGMGNVEIHIHAESNVDLPRVRQEVESALAKTLLQSQRQRGVYG
jgi:hypothetical protein